MDDLISRQAAINAIENTDAELTEKDWDELTDAINALPSAQPEQKKGEWINRSLNILYPDWERYTCSVCGKHSYIYDFCPNCGSYNGGEQDE